MHIEPFGVEIWMNAYETRCRLNLAETCVAAMTLEELLTLTGRNDAPLADLMQVPLSYGAIEGSERLRRAIAALYADRDPESVIVCHGTIGANDLAWRALVGAGDHVVSLVPTYQQHVSIPESLGARVDRLTLRPEDGYLPDLDALRALLRDDTRVLAFTNPNNPTGSLMPHDMQEAIISMADEVGATVLADEVYRGTAQLGDGHSPSVADLSPRAVATAGMSKAFSLAGLRLGWITAPPDVLEAVSHHRDYSTISVGMLDDHFATLALEHADRVLTRSRDITRRNLAILADWVAAEPGITWVAPKAGTTALLSYDLEIGSETLCRDLLADTGVLLTPGAVMGAEGTLRIGFANRTEDLIEGLPLISDFLATKRG
ncbi:aminotransferase class I/II-fold pyridoxal phosphate-dependent enzyme [Jannaschia sp. M317]|uniref:aminotransferase class I/II-fold pyridoxal phosphate-dependent enzyme n=1 Tax=Jannaschia sp. M317 TaxID=2867011 RepID=UPI0021A45D98|nr:aminotransferase class I/II-fold pyridoxal phosphate-dependent enzyme [Jannaschia sp. M317]UWQ16720.1 aminotransferase class I/II-fold pyridoxal phosphate-dependent enzyme [Jannaschia sp. M317]